MTKSRSVSAKLATLSAACAVFVIEQGCTVDSSEDHLRQSSAALTSSTALGLRWLGYVDLETPFNAFFNGNFTLSAKFFPQYGHIYRGPILASADGTFVLGQGDYREEPNPSDKLVLTVGGQTRTYLVPGGDFAQKWYDVTLRRRAARDGTYVFDVFLDGTLLCPSGSRTCSLAFPSPPSAPAGNVRIGRTSEARTGLTQFYGLVDDVAIFSAALTDGTIATLTPSTPLTTALPNLFVGYTFDNIPSCSLLPAGSISSCYTVSGDAYRQAISSTHTSSDAAQIANPATHWSHGAVLPFKSGQVWQVIQGYGETSSHNGYAAFSYDFVLADTPTVGKPMHPWNTPTESCGEPMFAVASGTILRGQDDGNWVDPKKNPTPVPNVDFDGPDVFDYRLEPNFEVGHLHLFTGSIDAAFQGQTLPSQYNPSPVVNVTQGQQIARVGTRNGCHLHLSASNWDGLESSPYNVTVPLGFWAYESCTSDCAVQDNWHFVSFGVPRTGEFVRR